MAAIRYSFVYRDGAADGSPVRCFYWCNNMVDITYSLQNGDLAFEESSGELYLCVGGLWVNVHTGPHIASPGGPPGFDGINGEDGYDGFPGAAGAAGVPGAPGVAGAIGPAGPIGPPGFDAEEAEYPFVIPGPPGPKGATGSAGGTITATVITMPYASRRQVVTVVDALVTAVSKIIAALGTNIDTAANSDDDIELLSISTVPAAGSFKVRMNFLTPVGGPLTLHYMVG